MKNKILAAVVAVAIAAVAVINMDLVSSRRGERDDNNLSYFH